MFWRKRKKGNSGEATFKARVSEFWQWFEKNAQYFYDQIEAGKCPELQPEVSEAVSKLGLVAWVFGPGPEDKGGHSFTLSGEGILHKQFLTQYWLEQAPDLPGWTFYGERQPGNVNTEECIEIAGRSFCFGELWLSPKINHENEVIDITAWHHHFADVDSDAKKTVLFLMLDGVLGEFGTDNWIGKIDISDDRLADAIQIIELRDFILDIEIKNGWEKHPPTEAYTLYEIPELDKSFRRSDIFAGSTANYDLIREFMNSDGQMENLLIGTGADFIYVAFSTSIVPSGSEVDFRAELEDSINGVLKSQLSGRVFGGAFSRQSVYIDMIIFDGINSIQLLEQFLRGKNLPEASINYFERNKKSIRV